MNGREQAASPEEVVRRLAGWYAIAGEVDEPLEQRHLDMARDALDGLHDCGYEVVRRG